jgi:hypothetical protein
MNEVQEKPLDLLDSNEFRAQLARLELRLEDLPFSPQTIVKLKKGRTDVGFNRLIAIGKFVGLRPQLKWVRIESEESSQV